MAFRNEATSRVLMRARDVRRKGLYPQNFLLSRSGRKSSFLGVWE